MMTSKAFLSIPDLDLRFKPDFNDLSDYDYIDYDQNDLSPIGSALDNVVLTAGVPEPSSLTLLGLLARRRR